MLLTSGPARRAFFLGLLPAILLLVLGCAGPSYPRPKYPEASVTVHPREDPDLLAIGRQYEVLTRSFESSNIDSILSVRSPDFSTVPPGAERQDAAQMRDVLRQFFELNKPPIRTWMTILRAERLGADTIRVDVFQQATRYQDLAGKRRFVEHDVTQTETWRREAGVWKLLAVDSVRDRHRWVDGKPVDPSKPFDPKAPPFLPATADRKDP